MTTRICFLGTPQFAVPSLAALVEDTSCRVDLVITQPDRVGGRGRRLLSPPVCAFAKESNIPVLQPASIRQIGKAFLDEISRHGEFELAIVVAYGQILPPFFLEHFRLGCLNVHASLLPRWRGAAPIQRAILSGDKMTGVGLMKMDAGLDTGPVYVEQTQRIDYWTTADELTTRLATLGAGLLRENLPAIVTGELEARPQLIEGVTYAKKITKEEALIDWGGSADEISRQIRAFTSVPGGFSMISGKRVKLFSACSTWNLGLSLESHSSASRKGGRILGSSSQFWSSDQLGQASSSIGISLESALVVSAVEGAVLIPEVQVAGRGKISGAEFLRGYPEHVGESFEGE